MYSIFTAILMCYVTLSHLRSKEITGMHKPCIPHSNDSSATTEYKPICIHGDVVIIKCSHHFDLRL